MAAVFLAPASRLGGLTMALHWEQSVEAVSTDSLAVDRVVSYPEESVFVAPFPDGQEQLRADAVSRRDHVRFLWLFVPLVLLLLVSI